MLRALQERYPLPPGWGAVEAFTETVELEATCIALSGLVTVGPDGEQVTGSAATLLPGESPVARSYFELLERVSIASAIAARDTAHDLSDRQGRRRARATARDLFPESPAPERWRHARSNGVALHLSWSEACERAAAELAERDRVLRSWYGDCGPPRRSALSEDALVPRALRERSAFAAYEWPAGAGGDEGGWRAGYAVVAVVGVPRRPAIPLVYGFGAGRDAGQATKAAAVEAIQRFAFLFDGELPAAPPESAPTPSFHQDFFLHEPSRPLLLAWLEGAGPACVTAGARTAPLAEDEPLFVDLTPQHLRGKLWVAKAVAAGAEPLVFGEPAPHRASVPPSRRVHPIA